MSWIGLMVEQQLADAARNGELDVAAPLKGQPVADLDARRPQGWWARDRIRLPRRPKQLR